MSRVLVTGASGFVGASLVPALISAGHEVRRAVRGSYDRRGGDTEVVSVGDIGPDTDWRQALDRVDCVVHLAARVHVMRDAAADPLASFRHVNVEGTRALAVAAGRAGVRRFIFVSSIKAMAEQGRELAEADAARPSTPYGISKLEAETALRPVADASGVALFILRPPLVYGPGVGANFRRLLQLCDRSWPLPLGGIRNRRSLIYVGNLADALLRCVSAPGEATGTYVLHDGEPVSTPELARRIARALGRPAHLVPVPAQALGAVARLIGKQEAWERVAGSLTVNDCAFRAALDWMPPHTLDQGLRATAAWYRGQHVGRSGEAA